MLIFNENGPSSRVLRALELRRANAGRGNSHLIISSNWALGKYFIHNPYIFTGTRPNLILLRHLPLLADQNHKSPPLFFSSAD